MIQLSRFRHSAQLPTPAEALPGRTTPMPVSGVHTVLKTGLLPPFPQGCEQIIFGLGCFWGAERRFWQQPGIHTTAVGYSGGLTPNPSYEEVCSGQTGHNEVVLVVFDPDKVGLEKLLSVFWESHNPTQGMRQGNDIGTQYRSGIYCSSDQQLAQAEASLARYQQVLSERYPQLPVITTEICRAGPFYYAEGYHQQYLDKNPGGYCGLGGLGVACPSGLTAPE